MITPAVTVPPAVIPHKFEADDDGNPGSVTTPGPGTGAPLEVVTPVPAPTNSGTAPELVIVTEHGPGGTSPIDTTVPFTVNCRVSIT